MSSSSSSSSSSLSPSPVSALPPTPGPAAQRQLSHADKLRKVINELVETERTYVKVSSNLSGINERFGLGGPPPPAGGVSPTDSICLL